jgi:hypothetical protein
VSSISAEIVENNDVSLSIEITSISPSINVDTQNNVCFGIANVGDINESSTSNVDEIIQNIDVSSISAEIVESNEISLSVEIVTSIDSNVAVGDPETYLYVQDGFSIENDSVVSDNHRLNQTVQIRADSIGNDAVIAEYLRVTQHIYISGRFICSKSPKVYCTRKNGALVPAITVLNQKLYDLTDIPYQEFPRKGFFLKISEEES